MQRIGSGRSGCRLGAAAWSCLIALALASTARAHGTRLPFAQWGGFNAGALRCQRVIAGAAAECAATRWALRDACRRGGHSRQDCDADPALMAAVAVAQGRALDRVDQTCSERQLQDLQFLGTFDAEGDVITFCRTWAVAAESAVYDAIGPPPAPSAAQATCIAAAADAVGRTMGYTFRNRRQCMDQVASLPLAAPDRAALLDRAGQRRVHAYGAVAAALTARCGDSAFTALYGRPAQTFVAGIGARADCIGAQFYVQDAVLCPAAVCGNGITESPDEDCDDGNTRDGDACPANCRTGAGG
jgi:cysteine-rich repeat protein